MLSKTCRPLTAVSPRFFNRSSRVLIFSSLWRYFCYHFLRDFASFVIRSRRRRRLGTLENWSFARCCYSRRVDALNCRARRFVFSNLSSLAALLNSLTQPRSFSQFSSLYLQTDDNFGSIFQNFSSPLSSSLVSSLFIKALADTFNLDTVRLLSQLLSYTPRPPTCTLCAFQKARVTLVKQRVRLPDIVRFEKFEYVGRWSNITRI